jgi:hypothetical protein
MTNDIEKIPVAMSLDVTKYRNEKDKIMFASQKHTEAVAGEVITAMEVTFKEELKEAMVFLASEMAKIQRAMWEQHTKDMAALGDKLAELLEKMVVHNINDVVADSVASTLTAMMKGEPKVSAAGRTILVLPHANYVGYEIPSNADSRPTAAEDLKAKG